MVNSAFTINSTLKDIRGCPQFAPFAKYVAVPFYGADEDKITIADLKAGKVDPEATVYALNKMVGLADEGKLKYLPLGHGDAGLYCFICDRDAPAVLVLSGGAYLAVCSIVEGFPAAARLVDMGYNVFVGQYRTGEEAHFFNPFDDVAEMVALMYSECPACSERGYAVMGFSAGGHLAACWGCKHVGYAKYHLPAPDGLALAYPVITMLGHTHEVSRRNLLGESENDPRMRKKFSVEKNVDGDYPKSFVWSCKDDEEVPSINGRALVEALQKNAVAAQYMGVNGTKHGLGIARGTEAEGWVERAMAFIYPDFKR